MIVDVHAHYTPRNFSAFMGDRFASPTHLPVKRGMARHPFSDTEEDIEGRFRLMDEAGVGRQILSPNHPPYLPDEAECVTAVQMLNDGYAEFAHRHPDRISSYVMLPLPHIDAALKEMERGFDQLGCVGVNMNISCLNRSVAETEFEPIYEEMNRGGGDVTRRRDLCAPHDRQADPAPLPQYQVHRAAFGRPDPDAAQSARPAGAECQRSPPSCRSAKRHRQEVFLRHRLLWLESGLFMRARSVWRRSSGDRQRLSGIAGLRGL